MSARRINIEIGERVTDVEAIACVAAVVGNGRVSKTGDLRQYVFHAEFSGRLHVASKPEQDGGGHSFLVWREE